MSKFFDCHAQRLLRNSLLAEFFIYSVTNLKTRFPLEKTIRSKNNSGFDFFIIHQCISNSFSIRNVVEKHGEFFMQYAWSRMNYSIFNCLLIAFKAGIWIHH